MIQVGGVDGAEGRVGVGASGALVSEGAADGDVKTVVASRTFPVLVVSMMSGSTAED